MKNYKVTSNETLAKIQINKTKKKYVKMTNIQIYNVYIYIYINMKIYKYIVMYIEKDLCESIKEYIKSV